MLNDTRMANTMDAQSGEGRENTDGSRQQASNPLMDKNRNESKPVVTRGLLTCCRSSKHKVTTCKGTFK